MRLPSIILLAIVILLSVGCSPKTPKDMVYVKGGTFQMGSTNDDSVKMLVHSVTVNKFYIGKYEVTQKEWEDVMGSNPSRKYGFGNNYPVYFVSWYDAVEFCNAKSETESLTPCYDLNYWSCDFTANGYRLPTEAEWEFAARGGNRSNGYQYSGSNDIDSVAWYRNNASKKTHPVGRKEANELGVYDMTGNVFEWCNDWYERYSSSSQTNPRGASTGSDRVYRGGSSGGRTGLNLAFRHCINPDYGDGHLGFRIVKNIPE